MEYSFVMLTTLYSTLELTENRDSLVNPAQDLKWGLHMEAE